MIGTCVRRPWLARKFEIRLRFVFDSILWRWNFQGLVDVEFKHKVKRLMFLTRIKTVFLKQVYKAYFEVYSVKTRFKKANCTHQANPPQHTVLEPLNYKQFHRRMNSFRGWEYNAFWRWLFFVLGNQGLSDIKSCNNKNGVKGTSRESSWKIWDKNLSCSKFVISKISQNNKTQLN